MTGSMPAVVAARIVPVSLGLQSRHSVVAMAATADRRLTPRLVRIGKTVTINNMARPEALLMARPRHMPRIHVPASTIYGERSESSGRIVSLTSARLAPMWSM